MWTWGLEGRSTTLTTEQIWVICMRVCWEPKRPHWEELTSCNDLGRRKHKMQEENAKRERDYGIYQDGGEAVDLLRWKIRCEVGWGLHSPKDRNIMVKYINIWLFKWSWVTSQCETCWSTTHSGVNCLCARGFLQHLSFSDRSFSISQTFTSPACTHACVCG